MTLPPSLPLPRTFAVPLFVIFGGASAALAMLVISPEGLPGVPILSGLLLGGSLVLPAAVGIGAARSVLNRVSVTVCLALISFPAGTFLFLRLFPGNEPSIWPAVAFGLPIGVPFAVSLVLAHARAVEVASRMGVRFGFRLACLLIYAGYGAAGILLPALHFALMPVNLLVPVHVLLWGGGMTVVVSQALAMTTSLSVAVRLGWK